MRERIERVERETGRNHFGDGLTLLATGYGFLLVGWWIYLDEGLRPALLLPGVLGVVLFLLGVYFSTLGAARIDR